MFAGMIACRKFFFSNMPIQGVLFTWPVLAFCDQGFMQLVYNTALREKNSTILNLYSFLNSNVANIRRELSTA